MSGSSSNSERDIMLAIPNEAVSAQELVKGNYTLAGWLRKRGRLNIIPGARKVFPWNHQFVVLHQGCLYNYKSETSRRPSRAFSLYGYNTVYRAGDVLPAEAPWAFKICHTYPEYKTYYFSAMTEQHMKEWMKQVKFEMRRANHKEKKRTSADGQEDAKSLTYEDIEKEIYTDPSELVINETTPIAPKADDLSDDENYVDSEDAPRSPTPPVQPRPPLPKPITSGKPGRPQRDDQRRIADELNKKLVIPKVPPKPQQKSPKQTAAAQRQEPDGKSVRKHKMFEFPINQMGRPTPPANDHNLQSPSIPTEVAPPPPDTSPEKDYWTAIYYDEKGRKPAGELIRELAENGVFLIRDSTAGDSKVLVVFFDNMPKKYKIFQDNAHNSYHLVAGKTFTSIEELIYHYLESELPCGICLSIPYFQHPKYRP